MYGPITRRTTSSIMGHKKYYNFMFMCLIISLVIHIKYYNFNIPHLLYVSSICMCRNCEFSNKIFLVKECSTLYDFAIKYYFMHNTAYI